MKNIKFLVLLIFSLLSLDASAQSEYQSTKTESPYFKSPNGDTESVDLLLKSSDATVRITGMIADVAIEQTYKNDGSKPLEATYVFPMSDKAAIYSLEMHIGSRVIMASIKERDLARQAYEAAKSDGHRASLLEQERPNVFTMNVANIQPDDIIKVVVRYTEFIIPDEGMYSFVFPTVVGPRYNAKVNKAKFAAQPYSKSGVSPLSTFSLNVDLLSNIPISYMECKTHKTSIHFTSDKSASIRLSNDEIYAANRDFILNYSLKGQGIQSGIQLYDHGKEKFFMAMIQPPKRVANDDIPPREYVFVVDISGSMHGFPLEVSKKLLRNLISNLKPTDQFNVVLFAGSSEVLSPVSLSANKSNIDKSMRFIDNNNSGGSTELINALQISLALPRASQSLSRSVVIVTDGYVTVEKEAMELIRSNLNNTNVYAFGIGSSVNRFLINGLAHAGGGLPFVVIEESEADSIATKFRKYIQTPVLSNIQVKYQGLKVYDLITEKLPDVMADRPVIITGKYKGNAEGKITLSGYTGKGKFSKVLTVNNSLISEHHNAIRYLWAREKIQSLSDYGDSELDSTTIFKITKLGLDYNLMTSYTSFIAVDRQEIVDAKGELRTVEQVLPIPQGVSNYAIGADFNLMGAFMATPTDLLGSWWHYLLPLAFGLLCTYCVIKSNQKRDINK